MQQTRIILWNSVLTLMCLAMTSQAMAEDPLFERDVLPILTRNCLGCHGGLKQQGSLDLRTIPAMLDGGENGPAVKTGDIKASLLWERIAAVEMPEGEKKLPPAEKEILRQWILAGLPTVAQRERRIDPLLASGRKHAPIEVAAAIDRHVEKRLTDTGLSAAALCKDDVFLRRVYLDLAGRVPTAAQATEFLDSDAPDKRAKLIDELLASPQFGEQLGRTWRDWICPPELPSDPNSGKQPHEQSQKLGKWLGERFAANDSWDEIARQIIMVEGEIKDQPQVIFYGLVGEGGKPTPGGTARAIGSLFMGVQLQCAECHDDPYRTWAQEEHWGLAAFFRKINGDFNKITEKDAGNDKKNEHRETDSDKLGGITIPKSAFKNVGQTVQASFLGADKFQPQRDEPLRPPFADWLTAKENPYFAKAFVNRTWFYCFNRGIVHPIDDLRELNPPSHPGLLTLLANEFVASGFDVKHLFRCLCNSQAYQRSSRVDTALTEAQAAEQLKLFGRAPLRVLSADMLLDSLKLAYGDPKLDLRAIDPKNGNTNGESAPVGDAYLEFQRKFCTNEEDAADFTHGIPQLLTIMNHPRLTGGSKALDEFRKSKPEPGPEEAIAWLYLSTLSRPPSREEAVEALEYVNRANDLSQGLTGVLWMLVNRSEYLLVR